MASEALPAGVTLRQRPSMAEVGLAVAVAMVLADASVVVLALPDMLTALDATVTGVSWVITAFNLAVALAAVPAAIAARRYGPARIAAAGLVVFAAASGASAAAGSLETVIAARCVQAVSGAAVVCAALELLPAVARSQERGVRVWVGAAAVGSAVGPAIGGVLTQALPWRAGGSRDPAGLGGGVDARAAGPDRLRPRAHAWPIDDRCAGRPCARRLARRVDGGVPARRRRPRAPHPDAALHRRSRLSGDRG